MQEAWQAEYASSVQMPWTQLGSTLTILRHYMLTHEVHSPVEASATMALPLNHTKNDEVVPNLETFL